MGITRSACSIPPARGRHGASVAREGGRHAVLILTALLAFSACAPHRPADDFTISTKVKIELLADPDLGALRLDASTLDGVVTLSGTVRSPTDAERAVAAARRVRGVRGVKSELKIAPS